jgi:hypothetical protein
MGRGTFVTYKEMDRLEAAVEKMRSPGWTKARRLKMRLLIRLMRWSGIAREVEPPMKLSVFASRFV